MSKYRDLNIEELKSLQQEFVKFLVLNGIAAEDWSKFLKDDSEKAKGITSAFSDVVFEKILRKTQYLEKRTATYWYAFHCQKSQIVLIAINAKKDNIDFSKVELFSELQQRDLEIFTKSKPYSIDRELEIFGMIQNGATISDGNAYKQFALVLAELNAPNN